jgi:hypothetical protein
MKNNKSARLLVLSFCLLCVSCTATQFAAKEKQSDRKTLQLKGAVKTLEIPVPNGGLKDVYLFNKAGDIAEQSSVYQTDNRVYTKMVNFYDEAGRKSRAEFYVEGKLKTKSTFQYDDVNHAVEQIDYDAQDKFVSKVVKKYDEKGNLLEALGKISTPTVFGTVFGSGITEGSPDNYREFYSYDENGNLREMKIFIADVKIPLAHVSYVYNKEKQKIEDTEFSTPLFDKPPRISKGFHTYNKQGDVVETRHYEPIKESNTEEVQDRFKVIDDKGTVQNGLLISDKPFMILWDVSVCEYVYDAHDNWTKQTCKWKMRESKDFTPTSDTPATRIITYFP